MSNAQVRTYYQILEVPTTASVLTIKRALRDLRRQDHDDDFSIVLNNIEHTLLDASERESYDNSISLSERERVDYGRMNEFIPREEQGLGKDKFRSFFDFSNEDEDKGPDQESLRFSPYARTRADVIKENSQLSFEYSMQKSHIKMVVLGCVLAFLAAAAYKPIRVQLLAQSQSRDAVELLKNASKSIENYTRANKVFPSTLPADVQPEADAFYDLHLEKDGTNSMIVLNFNDNAVDVLRSHSLKYKSHIVPNIGLSWYCISSENFPPQFLPGSCKTIK